MWFSRGTLLKAAERKKPRFPDGGAASCMF